MRALLVCIALTVLGALPGRAAELVVVQSSRGAGYARALSGFEAACGESHDTVVVSDYAELDLRRMVREERPRLVVAVGDKALAAAKAVREVPVLAVLTRSLNIERKPAANVGGIVAVAAPEQFLKVFNSMGIKRIGIVYDRSKTGQYVARAAREARLFGVTLVTEAISSPRELQNSMERMRDRVDAVWTVPDSTVGIGVNLEALMLFCMENALPVVSFSREHLKYGAAAALEADLAGVGRQAGEMACGVLSGAGLSTRDPGAIRLFTNDPVLFKLGAKRPSLR